MSLPWATSLPQHNISCSTSDSTNLLKSNQSNNTTNSIHNDKESITLPASGGYYARRQIQREVDSQDQDSQDRDECPVVFKPSPQKKGGKFACMIDSNPELNPMRRSNEKEETFKKKINLNAHITDKFKDLYKIYEMVRT